MTNDSTFLELIRRYLSISGVIIHLLKDHFNEDNLLEAWRQKRITQKGSISTICGKIEYFFHGIGCEARINNDEKVDFNFDSKGNIAGFDAWRLTIFAAEVNKERFDKFKDINVVKNYLNDALSKKIIEKKQLPGRPDDTMILV